MTDQQIAMIARNYTTPALTLEDLMQEGRILIFLFPALNETQLIKKLRNKFQALKRKDHRYTRHILPLSYADGIGACDSYNFPSSELEDLIACGYTNKEIALKLGVNIRTLLKRINNLRE